MRSFFYCTLLFLLTITHPGFCQQNKINTNISYLEITDTTLINTVNNLVQREENVDNTKDNLFKKGLGYISLRVKEFSNSDTLIEYNINPVLISIKKDSPENVYPDFYSFINNRLILIQITVLNKFTLKNYSESSKKLIRNLVNNRLEKTKKVVFYDMNGKRTFTDKRFRIDYIKFDAGISIFVLKDKPPIIKNDKYNL